MTNRALIVDNTKSAIRNKLLFFCYTFVWFLSLIHWGTLSYPFSRHFILPFLRQFILPVSEAFYLAPFRGILSYPFSEAVYLTPFARHFIFPLFRAFYRTLFEAVYLTPFLGTLYRIHFFDLMQ